jgi:hypothetical protein
MTILVFASLTKPSWLFSDRWFLFLACKTLMKRRQALFFKASFSFTSPPKEWPLGDIMHKKNVERLQAMKIQKIILHNSFHDKKLAEVISKMTRLEVMGQLKEPIEVHLVPDVEKGEVLLDSRGRGSLQRENDSAQNSRFRLH